MRAQPLVGAPGRARTPLSPFPPQTSKGGAMDAAVRAWLTSQLGTTTDLADLEQRYNRLGTARAVAIEVLYERKAALIAQPGSVNVNGVVSVTVSENIKALERQITDLRAGVPLAPDESDPDGDGTALDTSLGIIRLTERPRR